VRSGFNYLVLSIRGAKSGEDNKESDTKGQEPEKNEQSISDANDDDKAKSSGEND